MAALSQPAAPPQTQAPTVAQKMKVAMEEFRLLKKDRESTVSSKVKQDVADTLDGANETLGAATEVLRKRYFEILSAAESVETVVGGLKSGKYRTVEAPDDMYGAGRGGLSSDGGFGPMFQVGGPDHLSDGGSSANSPPTQQSSRNSNSDGAVNFHLTTMLKPEVATDGDTISLRPGMYQTPLLVEGIVTSGGSAPGGPSGAPQVVTLQGHLSDCGMVVLDRTGEDVDVDEEVPFITVRGHRHLVVRNLTIQQTPESAASAIRVDGHSSLLMENCTITACSGPCVVAGKGSTVHLRRCRLLGTIFTCVKISGAAKVILEDCTLNGAEGCGICIEGDLGTQQRSLFGSKNYNQPEAEAASATSISHVSIIGCNLSGFDAEGILVKPATSGSVALVKTTIQGCGRHCLEFRDGYGSLTLRASECAFTDAGLSNVFLGVPAKKTAPALPDGDPASFQPALSFDGCSFKNCGMTSFYCALPMEALASNLTPSSTPRSDATGSVGGGSTSQSVAAQWEVLKRMLPAVNRSQFNGAKQFAFLLMLTPTPSGGAHMPALVEPSPSMSTSPFNNSLQSPKAQSPKGGRSVLGPKPELPASAGSTTSGEPDGFQQFLKAALNSAGNNFGSMAHPVRVVESTRSGVVGASKSAAAVV